MSDAFQWYGEEASGSVVVPSVQAIAVYTNPENDLVIRQEGSGLGDNPGDMYVVIPRAMVGKVIKAMREAIAP